MNVNQSIAPKVRTAGKQDLDEFFRLSGLLAEVDLKHSPFLAFIDRNGTVDVEIVKRARYLLIYPDDTPVMAQWPGQWRSDWFQMTVGDVRKALEATS